MMKNCMLLYEQIRIESPLPETTANEFVPWKPGDELPDRNALDYHIGKLLDTKNYEVIYSLLTNLEDGAQDSKNVLWGDAIYQTLRTKEGIDAMIQLVSTKIAKLQNSLYSLKSKNTLVYDTGGSSLQEVDLKINFSDIVTSDRVEKELAKAKKILSYLQTKKALIEELVNRYEGKN